MQLSHKLNAIQESATLAITQKVRNLKASGKDIIGLTLGEPDFDTPLHIREAAKKALDDGYTHYPPVLGYPELREAVAQKFRLENQLPYTKDNVMVSNGAKQCIFNAVMAVINPGDEVILPAPFWVSYRAIVEIASGTPIVLSTDIESAYKVTAEQLESAITPKTKLIIMSSPSNPSGSMYTREELAELVLVLERHPQVYIIYDEIYEHIAFEAEHVSLGTFESIFDRVITINGLSKAFAMTGWRIGFLAAHPSVVAMCNKLQGQSTSGINTITQRAAITALTSSLEPTFMMRDVFRKRRDMLYPLLQEIEGMKVILPDGAFYFYPDVSAFLGSVAPNGQILSTIDDLCLYLIDFGGVALIPSSAFGTKSHIRISYAYSEETLLEGIKRFQYAMNALKKPAFS